MHRRRIEQDLRKWKQDGARKALLIYGVRRTGKSTSAREFGKNNYEQVIEINFIRNPELKRIFSSPDPNRIYESIQALTGISVLPGKALLILEEIQECPQARTAIKFLVQDHRADLIETGSYMDVNSENVQSYPVGFEMRLPMYPMSFEEFLWALDIPDSTLEQLKKCYEKEQAVPEAIHERMLSLFRLYMVVGGMPEVVSEYLQTGDIARVRRLQQDILDLYRSDIQKYAERKNRLKICEVFDSIPEQLNAKDKRFKVEKIDQSARVYQYSDSFLWLEAAGITLPCYNVTKPVYPLTMNKQRSLFKLYLCDSGLLCCALGSTISSEVLNGEIQSNNGAILENVFAQSLRNQNFNLFFFDSRNNDEPNFLVQNQDKVDLLEIQTKNDYEKLASPDQALSQPGWKFQNAIVFSNKNISRQDQILYLPFYMVMFYEEKKAAQMIWRPDLSGLMDSA